MHTFLKKTETLFAIAFILVSLFWTTIHIHAETNDSKSKFDTVRVYTTLTSAFVVIESETKLLSTIKYIKSGSEGEKKIKEGQKYTMKQTFSLNDLEGGTKYDYKIYGKTEQGKYVYYTGDFLVKGVQEEEKEEKEKEEKEEKEEEKPKEITGLVSQKIKSIGHDSVSIEGQFNNPSKVGVIYTKLPEGHSKVQVISKSFTDVPVSARIEGLEKNTRYRLRLIGKDATGKLVQAPAQFFKTLSTDSSSSSSSTSSTSSSTGGSSSSTSSSSGGSSSTSSTSSSSTSSSSGGSSSTSSTSSSGGSCYNPWANNGNNLTNRVRRLMNDPHRTGFGRNTTGGTQRLVTVTNPSATGNGSFTDVMSDVRAGDYIIFDPAHNVYNNGCRQGCNIPGSITIDGSQPNGRVVTLRRNDVDTYNPSLRFRGGNTIMTNIIIDHNNLATAVGIGNGENYWFNAFEIIARHDDGLGIGNASSEVEDSADNITISRYKVIDSPKGILVNTGGQSCRGNSNIQGSNHAIDQRRSHITIINSELAGNTRNVLNSGSYVDIVGTYIHGRVENTITRWGGQTIVRCSYIDSRTVNTRGIHSQEGPYMTGENATNASFCPQDSETFLDNNVYRQKNFSSASSNPRINVSGSDIDTNAGGHMTNGRNNWNDPNSGRSVFNRPYESEIQKFCDTPVASSDAGPEFTVENYCDGGGSSTSSSSGGSSSTSSTSSSGGSSSTSSTSSTSSGGSSTGSSSSTTSSGGSTSGSSTSTSSTSSSGGNTTSRRVLFVGNSYMMSRPSGYNSGSRFSVFQQFEAMLRSQVSGVSIRTNSIGGGSLKEHWDRGTNVTSARGMIQSGQYDTLVIQGNNTNMRNSNGRSEFNTHADRFANLAKSRGMKVVFYGLWASDGEISVSGGDRFGPNAHTQYSNAANRNGALYAPNGMVYGEVYKTLATRMGDNTGTRVEDLMTQDSIHPGAELAYLAASTLYSAVTGQRTPGISTYKPYPLSNADANLYRDASWQYYNQYK